MVHLRRRDNALLSILLFSMTLSLLGGRADAAVVGLWRFNEASGNASDSSGNNNVGTFVGSNAIRGASKPGFGNALALTSDQVNRAYVQVPGNYSLQVGLNAGDPWSVTAWAFENSDGFGLYYNTYGTILSQKDPAVGNYGLEFQSGANGDEQYYMWHGNNTALQKATAVAPTLDVWNHHAYVYNGTDYIMYINGVEKYRSTVGSQSLNFAGYTGAVEIGGNLTKSPSRNWDGLLDDVAIFNQALSPSDISTVMGGNFAPYTSPLPVPASAEWGVNNFGLWNTTTNWVPIVVPSTVTTAVFGNKTSEPTTVVADSAVTVKGIQFNQTQPYAIAGAGSVTIDTASGNGSISVLNAGGAVTNEFQLPVNLAKTTDVNVASGTVLEFDNQLNLNGNTLNVSGAGRVNINNDSASGTAGSVINSGNLGGSGTIRGTLTNNVGGKIAVGISGTGAFGVQGLTVTGTATLSGSLDISLLNGFTPSGGNTFTVLTAANIVNNGLMLSGSSAGFSVSVVGGTSLVLTYAGGVPGDYSGNGVVDAADYTLWRDTLGSTTNLGADGSGNGVIDQADYTYWKNRFGNTSGSGSLASSSVVPEPAAWALVAIACCLGLTHRKSGRSISAALSMLLCIFAFQSADATVLTFEGDVSNFNNASPPPAAGNLYGPLGNGSTIVQEYGDNVAGPTQTNIATADFGTPPYWYNFTYGNNGEGYTPNVKVGNQITYPGATTATATRSWLSAGNLSKVSYPAATTDAGGKWYFTFTADPGFTVTLISADLVRFNSVTLPATVNVYSGDVPTSLGALLYTSGTLNVSDVGQTVSPYVTSNALTLEFVLSGNTGDHLYNWAADNIVFSQPGPPVLSATWNFNGSGTWNKGQNWTPVTVLNGNDRTAVFGNAITTPSTVVMDSDITVKKLQFNHNVSYNLAGADELTLAANSGNASIEVLNAGAVTHKINVNTTLASNTDVSVATGTTLEFNNRLRLGAFNLSKTGAGMLKINNVIESTGGSLIGGSGSIGGGGSLSGDLINTGATIAPGNSPGVFTIGGDYLQSDAGKLQIELGGVLRGSEYDVLQVGGDVTLDGGTLELLCLNGFVPVAGTTFDVLDFATISGSFDTLMLPKGVKWDTGRLYVDGSLTVTSVVPEPSTVALVVMAVFALVIDRRKAQAGFAIR